MDRLIDLLFSNFKEKNYELIAKFGIIILIFFAPSFSYFFLYDLNFFQETDFLKLLILCLLLNIIFFSLIYLYKYISFEIKPNGISEWIKKNNVESPKEFDEMMTLYENEIKDSLFKETSSYILVSLFILYYPIIIRIMFPNVSLELAKQICLNSFLYCVIASSFSNYMKFRKQKSIYNKSLILMYVFIFLISILTLIIKFYENYTLIVK